MAHTTSDIDFDKYRLRNFVERLIDIGEVEDPRQAGAR